MAYKNQAALITGGTSGIGFAVAKRFAEKGSSVMIVGRNEERGLKALKELKQIHSDIDFISADVTKGEQVRNIVSKTINLFGRLDYAFNNAANDEVSMASTHEFSEEDYDRLMNVTLKSVWLCMKYELQVMDKQRSGVIVNTASVDALLCSAGTAVYSADKSGVIALSKSIAQEYGKHGIRVNTLSPGAIRTPLLERKFQQLTPKEVELVENRYKEWNALGRIGTPDEAASVAMWLFSDDSAYVTGQNLIADGGICFM